MLSYREFSPVNGVLYNELIKSKKSNDKSEKFIDVNRIFQPDHFYCIGNISLKFAGTELLAQFVGPGVQDDYIPAHIHNHYVLEGNLTYINLSVVNPEDHRTTYNSVETVEFTSFGARSTDVSHEK